MPAHGIWPKSKRNFACFTFPVQIKPRENSLCLRSLRHVMAGKIAEAGIVLKHHAAVLFAIPQARLGLNFHIFPMGLSQHIIHVRN